MLKLQLYNISIINISLLYSNNKIIKIINELKKYINFIKKNKFITSTNIYSCDKIRFEFIHHKKILIYFFICINLITELENILYYRLKVYWVYLTTQLKYKDKK